MTRRFAVMLLAVLTLIMAISWIGLSAEQTPAAQVPAGQTDLFKAIKAEDAALFGAVNTCDIKTLSGMVTDDLEFYHDLNGLAVGRTVFLESVKNNLCNKVTRELVEGSLEVHPLKGYGAVEMGVHRFHHAGAQDHDVLGEARFVHLWQFKDGVWKLSRVISFEHGTAK
jgi:ketosteroid isomerase-like protein